MQPVLQKLTTDKPTRFAKPTTDEPTRFTKPTTVPKRTRTLSGAFEYLASRKGIELQKSCKHSISLLWPTNKLQHWLSHFVLEVRKMNGQPYPPDTVHHIICGIMRHIRQKRKQLHIFRHMCFFEFRTVLDSEIKRLKAAGLASKGRQAEPFSPQEKDQLWSTGVLGDHSPRALLSTVFFQNGLNFALRSGSEHRRLRLDNCQIQIIEREGERPFLCYVEDPSKNNQGRLKNRKSSPKTVVQYNNPNNPQWCPVRIFKKYTQMCPSNYPKGFFYLQPMPKSKQTCWYSVKPNRTTYSE